jgi:hypothetical protein
MDITGRPSRFLTRAELGHYQRVRAQVVEEMAIERHLLLQASHLGFSVPAASCFLHESVASPRA